MSAEVAQTIGEAVAANVRRWRRIRGLDQQGLADRLAELGWAADRTAITRIEKGARKVTVDDLAVLAVALNVPPTLLLLPVHDATKVALTPAGRTAALNPWRVWEWMIGNEPLIGRLGGPFEGEWRSGAEPLWLYERVRAALESARRTEHGSSEVHVEALQRMLDATDDMRLAGYPTDGLIPPTFDKRMNKLSPSRHVNVGRIEEDD